MTQSWHKVRCVVEVSIQGPMTETSLAQRVESALNHRYLGGGSALHNHMVLDRQHGKAKTVGWTRTVSRAMKQIEKDTAMEEASKYRPNFKGKT